MILTDGVSPLTLPDDLEWTDEYAWSAVVQEAGHTLTGALVLEAHKRLAGRPITLEGADVWITRGTVDALRAFCETPGLELSLTLADARTFAVVFRHQDAPALEARPVLFTAPMQAGDRYGVMLKLQEI